MSLKHLTITIETLSTIFKHQCSLFQRTRGFMRLYEKLGRDRFSMIWNSNLCKISWKRASCVISLKRRPLENSCSPNPLWWWDQVQLRGDRCFRTNSRSRYWGDFCKKDVTTSKKVAHTHLYHSQLVIILANRALATCLHWARGLLAFLGVPLQIFLTWSLPPAGTELAHPSVLSTCWTRYVSCM